MPGSGDAKVLTTRAFWRAFMRVDSRYARSHSLSSPRESRTGRRPAGPCASPGEAKMLTPAERRKKIRTVFRVASGNFLEMYDFMIFGYFSAAIGRAYFPAESAYASLMFC